MPAIPGIMHVRKPVHADALTQALAPDATRQIPLRIPTPIPAPQPALGTVLLINDHYLTLHRLADQVRSLGYEVVTAVDGVQALELAADRAFAVILTDAHLPDLTPKQMKESLRRGSGPNRLTPLLACSPSAVPHDQSQVELAGVEALLQAPLETRELAAALQLWAPPHQSDP
jgi:CheY-like chemotaxis protein